MSSLPTIASLFHRRAGRGLDGNTLALLVPLADRLASNYCLRRTLNAYLDPFHAVISVANLIDEYRLLGRESNRATADGELAKARIVHFATHGFLAGESEEIRTGEPSQV